MPGLNLTRDEAQARARALHLDAYDIDLDFSRVGDVFGSVTTVRFGASEPGGSTFMDLVASRVHAVTLNGRALDPDDVYRDGRITLDGLAAANEVRIGPTAPIRIPAGPDRTMTRRTSGPTSTRTSRCRMRGGCSRR